MNYQDKNELAKAANILIAANDPMFSYTFTKNQDQIENFQEAPEIYTMERYNYSIKQDEGSDTKLPTLCPLSLAACAGNLADMEAFYAAKFPRLPNEYHGILARYSAGQTITKKEVKNSIKKAEKKGSDLPVGLTIARKEHVLKFD